LDVLLADYGRASNDTARLFHGGDPMKKEYVGINAESLGHLMETINDNAAYGWRVVSAYCTSRYEHFAILEREEQVDD
jgi:hypothetical protein